MQSKYTYFISMKRNEKCRGEDISSHHGKTQKMLHFLYVYMIVFFWHWTLTGFEIVPHTVCIKHESTYSISSALHAWSGSWTSSRALSTCVREETRSRLCPGRRKRLTDCRYSSEALNTRKSYLMKNEREAERDGNKKSRINYSEDQHPISHYISIILRATSDLEAHEPFKEPREVSESVR